MESLGTRLRVERLKRNMSQEKVSEKLNMVIKTLSGIENDKGNHRQSTLNKLAELYGVDIDESK